MFFSNKKEYFDNDDDYTDDKYLDKLFDSMGKVEKICSDARIKPILKNRDDGTNKYFSETQFNNNYRDTLTAFNNIAPAQKQLFNRSDYPVKFINPKLSEVKDLIKSFIREVNTNVKNNITEFMTSNSGWDEMMPEQKVKSGWDKQQEELGLPCSIYNEPAKKSKVKLLKVDHIEKYATEEQIRYVAFLILQKVNVKDQMVVRVSFVLDNMLDERHFFTDSDRAGQRENVTVNIEEIFVIGYLTDTSFGSKSKRDDFYNFENIEKDGMMDQEEILKQLNIKYANRQKETNGLSVNVSDPMVGLPPNVVNNLAIEKLSKARRN